MPSFICESKLERSQLHFRFRIGFEIELGDGKNDEGLNKIEVVFAKVFEIDGFHLIDRRRFIIEQCLSEFVDLMIILLHDEDIGLFERQMLVADFVFLIYRFDEARLDHIGNGLEFTIEFLRESKIFLVIPDIARMQLTDR